MNKKINKIKALIKGSSIAMIVAGVLIAGVALAATSIVLSGSVTTRTDVSQPVEMSVNEGRDGSVSSNPLININTTGGSDFTFTTVAKNNANNAVNGYPVIVIEEIDEGKLTGEEFKKVLFDDGTGDGDITENNIIGGWNITELLYVVNSDGTLTQLKNNTWDNKKLVLFFDNDGSGYSQTYPMEAGEVNWNVLEITLNEATIGKYKIRSQYVYDLAKYASNVYSGGE